MKLTFEEDRELRTEGLFVFTLDDPPERPFVVRIDGRIVEHVGGTYELKKRPKDWPGCLEVEVCAGPFYTPPVRAFLAKGALHRADVRLAEAYRRMGGKE